MDALAGALEFGVGGSVGGFEFVVVGLREDFVLEEQLAAMQGAVGAEDFDLGFLEVGAGCGDVAALQLAMRLPFLTSWPGRTLQAEHASAERRKDADDVRGIGSDAGGDFEVVGARAGRGRPWFRCRRWRVGFRLAGAALTCTP